MALTPNQVMKAFVLEVDRLRQILTRMGICPDCEKTFHHNSWLKHVDECPVFLADEEFAKRGRNMK